MYAGKTISLIMAAASNGVIGDKGGIPWHDPEDLKWFKHQTMGKTVIFGARTFASLPPLAGRHIHVISKTGQFPNVHNQRIKVFPDIREAIAMSDTKDVFIGGGRLVYEMAEPYVDRFLLAHIRAEPQGDTKTPFTLPWGQKWDCQLCGGEVNLQNAKEPSIRMKTA